MTFRMRAGLPITMALFLLSQRATVLAATITATVTDEHGRALADAVVMITPAAGKPLPPLADSPIATAAIDQKDEAFLPFVAVVRTGGTVTFHNSDPFRHHVYSFAPIRRFEMVQAPGETSEPIRFDKPGAAAIGCNIHDQMTAYIYVTDAPWARTTDANGRAVISGVPAGTFVATVWHPRMRPNTEPPEQPVTLATQDSVLAVTIPVLPPRRVRRPDY